MASKTEICNFAISHLGTAKEISDIDTDKSEEALVCKRFYEICKDATLRDFAWPFAVRFQALQLVEENPTDEWSYSYRYPIGCKYIKRILSGQRNDSHQTRVPYKIGSDTVGKLIYCDKEDAEIEFIADIDNPNFFTDDFCLALSYRLASYIAPRITGGNAFGEMSRMMLEKYAQHLALARQNAFNEMQADREVESEFIRVRGGGSDDING